MQSRNNNFFDTNHKLAIFRQISFDKNDFLRFRDEASIRGNNFREIGHHQPVYHMGDRLYQPAEISSKKENKPAGSPSNPDEKVTISRILYDNLLNFVRTSSLHGLGHVGDTSFTLIERLFWLLSFFCAIGFAAYFINNIYVKYNVNPTIMSVNPEQTSVQALPFPAITICNMNQAKKNVAETILVNGTVIEKILLNDFCGMSNVSSSESASEGAAKWSNVHKFMIKVAQSCQEMVKVCIYREKKLDCNFVFNTELTDEGLCCTFNGLPKQNIFRNPQELNGLNLTYPPNVIEWNPEDGYPPNSVDDGVPMKGAGAGVNLGLTLVLDADVDSYYCSSSNSLGFKVQLHNPIENPKMLELGYFLSPGTETRVEVTPKITDASPSLTSMAVDKRRCLYVRERPLRYFKLYTQRNCNLECQANYTLDLCRCVPYYLPKDKDEMICGKKDDWCVSSAKSIINGPAEGNGLNCNCLPSCFELYFQSTITYGKFGRNLRIKSYALGNTSQDYFIKNMAVVHFYYISTQFTSNTKSEIYGFSEFLSNTGGLLGLFMGFSFLSAVEVIYFATLRLFCIAFQKRKKKPPENRNVNNRGASSVYPFIR